MKIRTKLLLSFFLIFSIGAVFLSNRLLNEIKPRYMESMEESLHDTANVLASIIENHIPPGRPLTGHIINEARAFRKALSGINERDAKARIYTTNKESIHLRVYITDHQGLVIFDSNNGADEGEDYSRWNDVYLTLRGKYGARSSRDDSRYNNVSVKYIAAPIRQGKKIIGSLTVAKPSVSLAKFISNANKNVIYAIILTFVAFIILSVALSIWVTQPIERLISYARSIADGKKTPAPSLPGRDIAELAVAFEEMRDKLEGKHYIENYVQDLTHELKSPISSIVGAAELIQEGLPGPDQQRFLENIQKESLRVKDIADRMLKLAAIERLKKLPDPARVDIGRLFKELVEAFTPVSLQKSISIEYSKTPGAVYGDRSLLFQALSNIIQNALDFSPTGGKINIEAERAEHQLVIKVFNEGPAIPDFARNKVFERFYSLERPDTRRKSTGLGLPFSLEVARLHQGSLSLENKNNGVLVTFSLELK